MIVVCTLLTLKLTCFRVYIFQILMSVPSVEYSVTTNAGTSPVIISASVLMVPFKMAGLAT